MSIKHRPFLLLILSYSILKVKHIFKITKNTLFKGVFCCYYSFFCSVLQLDKIFLFDQLIYLVFPRRSAYYMFRQTLKCSIEAFNIDSISQCGRLTSSTPTLFNLKNSTSSFRYPCLVTTYSLLSNLL
jgi:hypothetical protein